VSIDIRTQKTQNLYTKRKYFFKAGKLNFANEISLEFLERHQRGDWGIVGIEDAKENELSVREGLYLLTGLVKERRFE
jgi:hypothetical protein